MKNQQGFSLVQTLVAVGLTGVLGLILMKNQESTSKIKTKRDTDETISYTTKLIQTALSDRATCSLSLKGNQIGGDVIELRRAQPDVNDYNVFVPVGGNVVKKDEPIPGGVAVKKMTLISDAGKDYLEVEFDLDAKGTKKMIGSKDIKKRFQLQLAKSGPVIESCLTETSNLIQTSAVESCKAMGGTMVSGKCQFINNLVDTTPANCGDGASYKTEIVNGKVKLTCTPCNMVKKYIRWSCEKKVSGVNWLNICYYRTGCSNNSAVAYGLEFWEIGGTSASGGDTGSKGNCEDKRYKCYGEP